MQDRRQIKNTDDTQTKHNPEKANNTKHSKTKLPWFTRLLRHSARKRGGLILQCSRAHMGRLTSHNIGHFREKTPQRTGEIVALLYMSAATAVNTFITTAAETTTKTTLTTITTTTTTLPACNIHKTIQNTPQKQPTTR